MVSDDDEQPDLLARDPNVCEECGEPFDMLGECDCNDEDEDDNDVDDE